MRLPKLAIVGRPNVGKSALFNRICKQKIAIVDEAEGVTRDRLYAESEFFGFRFEVIDTGGIHAHSTAVFNEEIKRQAEIAIEEADCIIQVVDSQVGVTDLDLEVSKILLRTKKRVCLAVNKIDNYGQLNLIHQFHNLGISHMVAVSAAQGWQIAELLEVAFGDFPREESPEEESSTIKIAIVGRPNVGKSSLVNFLLSQERCIVSPIPGTTRDSVDISFSFEDVPYTLIDTAGVRRKKAEHEVVDKFAAIRTKRAIERADLCVLMIDVQEGMTAQDKKIANMIEEAGKGCIILMNKWDLVKGHRMEHCLKGLEDQVPFLQHCPKLFISAKTGRNTEKIFPLVLEVRKQATKRITTHKLNQFIENAIQKNHPPMLQGRRLRIYYMAQIEIDPPRFVLFVNKPYLMPKSYEKYIENQCREVFEFTGVPLFFYLKGKEKKEAPSPKVEPQGYERFLQRERQEEEESEDGEVVALEGEEDDESF